MNRFVAVFIPTFMCLLLTCTALNNGLARTPPMGWLSWERFECNTDCDQDPDSCIGERLLMQMADRMAGDGYKDVGYEYITVDDCWPAMERDAQGRLQPDPKRFPHGMKALANYIHSKGLKLGLYEDVGRHTCAGFPGCIDHYELDAQTLADWGVDMLKFDGCNTDEAGYDYGYPAMSQALNKTGRKIMYSCEWPVYSRSIGSTPNYTLIAEMCNTFRVYGDIYDHIQSIFTIINWYGDDQGNFSHVVAPGSFTDADMVVVGNYGLSPDEERVQFGMWAILGSQILLSVDLRTIRPSSRQLLQNKRVIAINQDPLGKPGKRVLKLSDSNIQVWTRPISPVGSYALGIINQFEFGYPRLVNFTLASIGLTNTGGYNISEVFDGHQLGVFKPNYNFTCRVNPSGMVMFKAVIHSQQQQNTKRMHANMELNNAQKQIHDFNWYVDRIKRTKL